MKTNIQQKNRPKAVFCQFIFQLILLLNPMEINIQNRNKWINWWLTRQVDEEKIIPKLIEIYKKYKHE